MVDPWLNVLHAQLWGSELSICGTSWASHISQFQVSGRRRRNTGGPGFLASSEAEEKAEAPRFRKRLCFRGIGREKQKRNLRALFWPLSVYMNVNMCIRSMNLNIYTDSCRYACNTPKHVNLKQHNNNNNNNNSSKQQQQNSIKGLQRRLSVSEHLFLLWGILV